MTFEEQCERYRQQQTVSGKRTQKALDQMAEKMRKVTGADVKSGTLTPVAHYLTGEIKTFIER